MEESDYIFIILGIIIGVVFIVIFLNTAGFTYEDGLTDAYCHMTNSHNITNLPRCELDHRSNCEMNITYYVDCSKHNG